MENNEANGLDSLDDMCDAVPEAELDPAFKPVFEPGRGGKGGLLAGGGLGGNGRDEM